MADSVTIHSCNYHACGGMVAKGQGAWLADEQQYALVSSLFDIYGFIHTYHLFLLTTGDIYLFPVLMKVFVAKFTVLFVLIIGYFTWFSMLVYPNLEGDLEILMKKTSGREYKSRIRSTYQHKGRRYVLNQANANGGLGIITIGDSFSQQDTFGYQQFLGEMICDTIGNIGSSSSPEQTFVSLMNSKAIPVGSVVIIESVERYMIERLCDVDFASSEWLPWSPDDMQEVSKESDRSKSLRWAIARLRILLGYKNPVREYKTTKDLFTHPKVHNELYMFDSPWESYEYGRDGDFIFRYISQESYGRAYENLLKIKKMADDKGIRFMYLIAADKYEVYEPFVIDEHPYNPTLERCPNVEWLINTKPFLQKKAMDGVKDIYWIYDTHWSPIGAKLVAEEIARRLHC